MKTILALLLLATSTFAKDIPWELATARTIPGKGKPQHCLEYATALYKDMRANGIQAHVLIYTVEPTAIEAPSGFTHIRLNYEAHALCIYWDNGNVYAMDNQLMRPIRISDGTAEHMARLIATPSRAVDYAYFSDTTIPKIKGWEPGPNYRLTGR